MRSRPGIVVHQADLDHDETVRRDGLRVTSLARALLDVARTESPATLEAAMAEAEYCRLLDPITLRRLQAGGPALRRLADQRLPVTGELRQALERRFARFLRRYGFPPAEVNRRVRLSGPSELVVLDVVWWDPRVAVELDGRQAHATARAFDADRRRDRRLAVQHGLQVVRVTSRHLDEEPDAIAADLRTLLGRRGAGRPAA